MLPFRLPFGLGRSAQPLRPVRFTGKELYELAAGCRAYATELARFDPRRVILPQCHLYNAWLRSLHRYDRLQPMLRTLKPARPVARWQVATLTLIVWILLYLVAAGRGMQTLALFLLNGTVLVFLAYYMLPERLFGTTIEEIEGRVLRVVLHLEEMLANGEIVLTEAAFFKARENLEAAHRELREQIDLAHREWQ